MITPENQILWALETGSVWHSEKLAAYLDLPEREVDQALEGLIRNGEVEAATIEGRLRYRRVFVKEAQE